MGEVWRQWAAALQANWPRFLLVLAGVAVIFAGLDLLISLVVMIGHPNF